MSAPKIMAIRMGIYALLIGYLLLDLFVFKGPLKKTLTEPQLDTEAAIAEAKAQGIVARVYYEPIYRKQLEERMKEYLWRRGRSIEETSFGERKMLRQVLLDEMIDELLVKIQVKVSPIEDYAVDPAELEEALAIEKKRLGKAFDELAKRSGWQGEEELKMRLGARIQRENYLKEMIHADVSEEEARGWYDDHREELGDASFEDSKESIIDTLTTYRRDEAWKVFRGGLLRYRTKGDKINKSKIQIFEENLLKEKPKAGSE